MREMTVSEPTAEFLTMLDGSELFIDAALGELFTLDQAVAALASSYALVAGQLIASAHAAATAIDTLARIDERIGQISYGMDLDSFEAIKIEHSLSLHSLELAWTSFGRIDVRPLIDKPPVDGMKVASLRDLLQVLASIPSFSVSETQRTA